MIPRYTPKIMSDLWSDQSKWERVLQVELAVADILAEDGTIPIIAADQMRKRAKFDVDKIDEYEAIVRHDVIAFLQSVGDSLCEHKRWLHLGLTSYDVIDTALSIGLSQAGDLIMAQLKKLRKSLAEQAIEHKDTLIAGRTHGVHAQPTTFGWKICGWIAEADRDIMRLKSAVDGIRVGKLSGAVGTYPTITPDQERRVCAKLGLRPDTISTQVIARDRHAEFIATLALIGGLVERIAIEIRLLQHSEVEEIHEPFGSGQRGSSAMPHKKNPVIAENMSGLARLLRSYVSTAYENMPLWHERDISHSSVERIVFPDATSVVYYLLERCCWTVENWAVEVDNMRKHVTDDNGLMASSTLLTALKHAGIDDEDIYKRIQQHAMAARTENVPLVDLIRSDKEIMAAVGDKLEELFDDEAVLKQSDVPLQRVGLG